jgi:hypothetical protein
MQVLRQARKILSMAAGTARAKSVSVSEMSYSTTGVDPLGRLIGWFISPTCCSEMKNLVKLTYCLCILDIPCWSEHLKSLHIPSNGEIHHTQTNGHAKGRSEKPYSFVCHKPAFCNCCPGFEYKILSCLTVGRTRIWFFARTIQYTFLIADTTAFYSILRLIQN